MSDVNQEPVSTDEKHSTPNDAKVIVVPLPGTKGKGTAATSKTDEPHVQPEQPAQQSDNDVVPKPKKPHQMTEARKAALQRANARRLELAKMRKEKNITLKEQKEMLNKENENPLDKIQKSLATVEDKLGKIASRKKQQKKQVKIEETASEDEDESESESSDEEPASPATRKRAASKFFDDEAEEASSEEEDSSSDSDRRSPPAKKKKAKKPLPVPAKNKRMRKYSSDEDDAPLTPQPTGISQRHLPSAYAKAQNYQQRMMSMIFPHVRH